MIKGINHTMIELNETGNEYYERALLIVRPEYASVQRAVLEDEARRLLSELDAPSAVKVRKNKWKGLLHTLVAAGAGCLLTLLFGMIF